MDKERKETLFYLRQDLCHEAVRWASDFEDRVGTRFSPEQKGELERVKFAALKWQVLGELVDA
jgi:hypothetical protein